MSDEEVWLAVDIPVHPGRVTVMPLCRPLEFFCTNLTKPCIYGPRFVHQGRRHAGTGMGFPQTAVTTLEV